MLEILNVTNLLLVLQSEKETSFTTYPVFLALLPLFCLFFKTEKRIFFSDFRRFKSMQG